MNSTNETCEVLAKTTKGLTITKELVHTMNLFDLWVLFFSLTLHINLYCVCL